MAVETDVAGGTLDVALLARFTVHGHDSRHSAAYIHSLIMWSKPHPLQAAFIALLLLYILHFFIYSILIPT